MTRRAAARATVTTIFGRLFEGEFATLDDIAISISTTEGMCYVDGTAGLLLWLGHEISDSSIEPVDASAQGLHQALHAASPEHDTVISGRSRHLWALLLEGLGPPPATSMMRNRGVPDIGAHIVAPEALVGPALGGTIERARELAEGNGMRHNLIITSAGLVVVSGAPPFEAMAHWHNVEFAARVECMRIEETVAHGA